MAAGGDRPRDTGAPVLPGAGPARRRAARHDGAFLAWFLGCIFGIGLGWLFGSPAVADLTPDNWKYRLWVSAALGFGLPAMGALAFGRALWRDGQRSAAGIIAAVAAMAAWPNFASVADLRDGPWAGTAEIAAVRLVSAPRHRTSCCRSYEVTLRDGRRFSYSERVASSLHPGQRVDIVALEHRGALLAADAPHAPRPEGLGPSLLWLAAGLWLAAALAAIWSRNRPNGIMPVLALIIDCSGVVIGTIGLLNL